MTLRRTAALTIALTLTGVLTACGGDDGGSTSADSATTIEASQTSAAGGEAAAGTVAVEGAWARTSPAAATNGAAYMTLTAAEDDALIGASVDPAVAKMTQVHETVMAEGTDSSMSMGSADSGTESTMAMGDGAMTMKEVDKVELPKGEAVVMKPGGYHIMLMELTKPLEKGSKIEITLSFEKAGEQKVSVPVLDAAP